MTQFRDMLLAGAYSDFVTDMQVLKHAMGPAGTGIILTTTWHTPEPPAWVPYESSKAAKNRLVYALGHHLREKGIPCIAVAPGWMRTELMEAHHAPGELDGRTETPHYGARAWWRSPPTPTRCASPARRWTSRCWRASTASTDLDGTQPDLNQGRF